MEYSAHAAKFAYSAMTHIPVFIKSNPKNIKHNQINIFNTFFILSDLSKKYKSTQIHSIGSAMVSKSNSSPNVHKATPTTELPIFAHKTTLTA